jgi:hypothetical protein
VQRHRMRHPRWFRRPHVVARLIGQRHRDVLAIGFLSPSPPRAPFRTRTFILFGIFALRVQYKRYLGHIC